MFAIVRRVAHLPGRSCLVVVPAITALSLWIAAPLARASQPSPDTKAIRAELLAKAIEASGRIKGKEQKEAARWDIAVAQAWTGDIEAALKMSESLPKGPQLAEALVHIGLAQAVAGDQSEAVKTLKRARSELERLEPPPEEHIAMVLAAMAWAGDPGDALQAAESLKPEQRRDSLVAISNAQADRADWVGARRTAVLIGPENGVRPVLVVAWRQLGAGDRDGAFKSVSEARRLATIAKDKGSIPWYDLAVAEALTG